MSRRAKAIKRELIPDSRYLEPLLTRFINCIMTRGKRSTAEGIVYGAFERVREKMPNEEPLNVFKQAVENCKPLLEVKSRRVGGANYQVPVEVRPDRRTALSMRWIILNARTRGERTMKEKLAAELLDASNKQGGAYRKREDVHKMAEANKAFAHYRW
ncbi:MAG: 30S ribosomal protein S7 [Candidatus Sumerlaeota bacterium]|nr:30S ribosomal protein S7 [Candidatus Sumerlaeota bacterium]